MFRRAHRLLRRIDPLPAAEGCGSRSACVHLAKRKLNEDSSVEIDMKWMRTALAGLLIGAALATPVLAAEEACLQNNRIWGWQALDQRTLVVTDRDYKRYTVHLTGGCIGLDRYAGASLVFRQKLDLGCLSQGDMIAFNSPGLGRMSCSVTNVEAAQPAPPK
jgi:hypothetical protein